MELCSKVICVDEGFRNKLTGLTMYLTFYTGVTLTLTQIGFVSPSLFYEKELHIIFYLAFLHRIVGEGPSSGFGMQASGFVYFWHARSLVFVYHAACICCLPRPRHYHQARKQ